MNIPKQMQQFLQSHRLRFSWRCFTASIDAFRELQVLATTAVEVTWKNSAGLPVMSPESRKDQDLKDLNLPCKGFREFTVELAPVPSTLLSQQQGPNTPEVSSPLAQQKTPHRPLPSVVLVLHHKSLITSKIHVQLWSLSSV